MKPLEFSARGHNRASSVGDEIAMAKNQADLAHRQQQAQDRAAAKDALIGIGFVVLAVILVMAALWFWHIPEPHIPAINRCLGSDAANRWCNQ